MRDYIKQYEIFYANGGYENADPVVKAKDEIKNLLDSYSCKTLLDYGCGDALQYTEHKLHEYWNLDEYYPYDPAIPRHNTLPDKGVKFDAVINTDVLEHIPEEYVYDIIDDIFSYAGKCVYFSICVSKAKAILPNGDNAHCTLKSHEEWVDIIEQRRNGTPTWVTTQGKGHYASVLLK